MVRVRRVLVIFEVFVDMLHNGEAELFVLSIDPKKEVKSHIQPRSRREHSGQWIGEGGERFRFFVFVEQFLHLVVVWVVDSVIE